MHSGAMDRTVVAASETTGILDLQKYDWQYFLGGIMAGVSRLCKTSVHEMELVIYRAHIVR